jgi:hypothetical protein
MSKFIQFLLGLVAFLVISFSVAYMIPTSRIWIKEYIFKIEYIDHQVDYDTRKMVEDTARATIVNYTNYVNTYNTYMVLYEQDQNINTYNYAIQAFTAANNQANIYNLYIQQNRFLWEGNLPPDIPETLEVISLGGN